MVLKRHQQLLLIVSVDKNWMNIFILLQKLVREIKSLIKEQKMAGKTGPLDLASEEMSDKLYERSLRRNSMFKKAAGGFMGFLDKSDELDEVDSTADSLISAMNQLAWERDLDLSHTAGLLKSPAANKIKEEPENANNSNSTAKSTRSRKATYSSSSSGARGTPTLENITGGRDNAAAGFSDEHTGEISPVETNTQRQQFNMKDLPKSAKGSASAKSSMRPSRRISPAPGAETVDLTDSRPNSNNSNSNVSDVDALPTVSEQDNKSGSAKSRWFRPRSRKQGIAVKQRSDSEDSKDSVFSETGSRKRGFGVRQDSNSSTSLSSLMNAWEGGDNELQSTDL